MSLPAFPHSAVGGPGEGSAGMQLAKVAGINQHLALVLLLTALDATW
jgi:hypothetical protein